MCLSVFIWDSVIDSKQVKESASEMNFLSEGWEIRTARVYNLLHFRTPVKTWNLRAPEIPGMRMKYPGELEKIAILFSSLFSRSSFSFLNRGDLSRLSLPVLASTLGCSCKISLSALPADLPACWYLPMHSRQQRFFPLAHYLPDQECPYKQKMQTKETKVFFSAGFREFLWLSNSLQQQCGRLPQRK